MKITSEVPGARVPHHVAFELLRAKGIRSAAAQIAEHHGANRRVVENLKGSIGVGSSESGNFMSGLLDRGSSEAYYGSQHNAGVFFWLVANGRRVPFLTRLSITSMAATAWLKRRGKPVPLTKFELSGSTYLEPEVAAALIVVSDSLLEKASDEARALISQELDDAIVACVDREFFELLRDTGTEVIESTGADADAARADLRTLFAACPSHKRSRFVLAAAPDVCHAAAFLSDYGGFVFPDVDPARGGFMFGTPLICSDAPAAGELWLIDASQVAVAAGSMAIDTSNQTNIEMADAPTSHDANTGTGVEMVSMFQTNSTAILAQIEFAAHRMRSNAVAILEGISWGAPVES